MPATTLYDQSLIKSPEDAVEFIVSVLEASTEYSIVGMDHDGTILLWNEGARRLYGYEPEEVIGKLNSAILHPLEDVEAGIASGMLSEAREQGKFTGTVQRLRKDGSRFTASVVVTPRRGPVGTTSGFLLISKDVSPELQLTEELKATQFYTRSLIESNIDALMTTDPLGIITDVNQQMEALTGHSQKLEAVGQLAGGIAHDFNNMLMPIMGFAELARSTLGEDHPARRYLDQISRAADRSATLTRQILAFARRQTLEAKVVDLAAVVDGCVPMLRRLIGENVEVAIRATSSGARVTVDPGQLEQVVLNLAINARDAMPDGGELSIETGHVAVSPGEPIPGVPPGRYASLSVTDTGTGMSEETLKRVFEPFFTTKPEGKGTGLGLAMVHGFVKQSGGHVRVESGSGTTFRLLFPAVSHSASTEVPLSTRRLVRGRGERILLVEDEELVRDLLAEILRETGHEVLVADGGLEALEIAERELVPIDLLVTDIIMPGISGVELARRMSVSLPELKVLFMSGYPSHPLLEKEGALDCEVRFVSKPATPRELLERVQEALSRSTE